MAIWFQGLRSSFRAEESDGEGIDSVGHPRDMNKELGLAGWQKSAPLPTPAYIHTPLETCLSQYVYCANLTVIAL